MVEGISTVFKVNTIKISQNITGASPYAPCQYGTIKKGDIIQVSGTSGQGNSCCLIELSLDYKNLRTNNTSVYKNITSI